MKVIKTEFEDLVVCSFCEDDFLDQLLRESEPMSWKDVEDIQSVEFFLGLDGSQPIVCAACEEPLDDYS